MSKTRIVLCLLYLSIWAGLLYAQNVPAAVWFFIAFGHVFAQMAYKDLYFETRKEYMEYIHSVQSILDKYQDKKWQSPVVISTDMLPGKITREDILGKESINVEVVPASSDIASWSKYISEAIADQADQELDKMADLQIQADWSMATPTPWFTVSPPTPHTP